MDEGVIGVIESSFIENVVLLLEPDIDLRPSSVYEHDGSSLTIEKIVLSSLGWSDGATAWVERTGYVRHTSIQSFHKS